MELNTKFVSTKYFKTGLNHEGHEEHEENTGESLNTKSEPRIAQIYTDFYWNNARVIDDCFQLSAFRCLYGALIQQRPGLSRFVFEFNLRSSAFICGSI